MQDYKIMGDKELYAALDKLSGDNATRVLQNGIAITGQEILVDSQKRLNANGSRATSKLFRSGKVTKTQGTGEQFGVDISYSADYAYYVEFGRKAGKMPPVNDIYQWVRKKGLAAVYSIKTKRRVSQSSTAQKEMSLAQAIARSIARKGTKAHPFLFPAFEAKRGNLMNRIKGEYLELMARISKN